MKTGKYRKKHYHFDNDPWGDRRRNRDSYMYVIAVILNGSGWYLSDIERLDNGVMKYTWSPSLSGAFRTDNENHAYTLVSDIRGDREDLNLKIHEVDEDEFYFRARLP